MKKLLTLIFIICPTIIWANVDFVLFRNDGTKHVYTISEHGEGAFYNCSSLTDVHYIGSEEEWAKITIGAGNGYFTDAEYTGGTEKSVTTGSGYYTSVR